MEAARNNADWGFIKKKPFGVIMSAQTVVSLFIVLCVVFAPFVFEGVAFVSGCAFTLFICSFIYNLFHIMGWNRKVLSLPGGINLFVPCTLMVFACSVIFFFLFLFGTLICLVGFFDSFRFTVRLIITYFFISLAVALDAFLCLRLFVLLFRAAPNSQILGLTTVLIDGDKTSRLEGSTTQFSPTATSGGTNPV
ncbi:unnamed protein product [Cylicocyclus nassatus]|uniref:MARVEL domain-containing protein n=1 Tax=Cylicocyclus nassatus TaxID=53992 RepID=A0AA36MDB1_CYLNA|nr:unnamed protein product [Cylicocyclus nassatus]